MTGLLDGRRWRPVVRAGRSRSPASGSAQRTIRAGWRVRSSTRAISCGRRTIGHSARSTSTRACPTSSSRCLRRTSTARHRSSRGRLRPQRGHHARRLLRSAVGPGRRGEWRRALREGIHCCAAIDEIGLLLAPDLYDPTPLPPVAERPPVTLAGDEFAPCVVEVGIAGAGARTAAARRLAPRPDRARRPRADRRVAGPARRVRRPARRPDRFDRCAAGAAAEPDPRVAGWVRQRQSRVLPPMARRRFA